ncbi:MAG: hypothetical protein KJN71_09505 [Acidimicrobiia bacterium]|nr:hypothetical protein [Acidimicrobiia bacterium]
MASTTDDESFCLLASFTNGKGHTFCQRKISSRLEAGVECVLELGDTTCLDCLTEVGAIFELTAEQVIDDMDYGWPP